MKINKIIYPLAATSLLLASCDDNVMEWRDSDPTVKPTEIPMELAEKISKYDFIKNYMAQYHPNVDITLGMGLDLFLDDETYRQVVLDNFQGVTFGNAMKHQSVVSSSGAYNWAKVDQFLAMNTGLKLHGHNLLWHTQQQQTYLKSLIAPQMVIESDPTNDISNMLSGDYMDFEGGTKAGWGSWGNSSSSGVTSPGHDSNYCMYLTNPSDASSHSAQAAVTFDTFLEPGIYKIRFYAKSDTPAGELQFAYQNGTTYGSQGGYHTFSVGTDWTLCEHECEITYDDVNRILINFGAVAGTYHIDDVEFGLKQDVNETYNYCTNGNFSDGTTGWTLNSGNDATEVTQISDNPSGNKNVLKLTAPATATQPWDLEIVSPKMPTLTDKKVRLSFYVKSDIPGKMRCAFDGMVNSYPWMPWLDPSGSWTEAFETSSAWIYVSLDLLKYTDGFAEGADEWAIKFDLGYVAGATYYLDDIRVEEIEETEAAAAKRSRLSRASSISYIPKTAEEKKTILLAAMEDWIKEAMTHVGNACTSWDVINEPIGDNGKIRGIEGGWMEGDSEPVESTDAGLNLNWASESGNGHFYWGYYCGWDYAVKAFEYAAKYSPNQAKLFVNEYNLETSPSKLAKLIEFVNYIDNHGAHVDGIGTQMHVQKSITKEQVDAMFQTLAATGKLIRITELDVAMGTATPSAGELQEQSDVYQMILTSYFENIPEAQQSAITVWTLSDSAAEHEYWLKDQSPNLFDAKYGRKIAYKGVCDAIAGKDVSEGFESPDYSAK